MDSNYLIAWTIWHIYVFNRQVYQWLQLCDLSGTLLPGIVCHLLPKYLQCRWGNTLEQPATSSIEEGTSRTHTIL